MSSHINEWPSLKDSPEYQKQLNERVNKIEQDEKSYKHLLKVNDVLNVLDLPDAQEGKFRQILDNQDTNKLKELAKQSEWEIMTFLINEKSNQINTEKETQNKELQANKIKYQKLKNILPKWIYSWDKKFGDIAKNLKAFEEAKTNNEKTQVLEAIINELKENDDVLKSIINELGWANPNNPKYVEFRDTLIDIDPSFKYHFPKFENESLWVDSVTNEVVQSIEKESWWMTNIDLNSDTPISKMSLVWSNYSFDKEINKEALTNIQDKNINKLKDIQNSFAVLWGVYTPFNNLINEIKQNWNKENLNDVINKAISHFSNDIFSELGEMYETMGIEPNTQINRSDIDSFRNIKSPEELRVKIENIKDKFNKIKIQILKAKEVTKKDYETELKEIVKLETKQEKKQKEVLKFMRNSWFDLLPKNISNRIIRELQSNILTIPWLDLSVKNIDLKNWNFWEGSAFIDKEAWINIEAKKNMLMFMNKLITWTTKEPLSVKGISSWTSIADPNFLKHKFLETKVVGGMGWNYGKIIENLKKVN